MSNVIEFGSLNGRLCGELAAALVLRVTKSGCKGEAFYHDSTSAFEATTAILTKLGLLAPVPRDDRPGETWYCLHELTMDADDMPDFLARTVSDGDTRLPELLEAFVAVFCEYDPLPDGREAFSPPDNLLSSMKVLTSAGFAERVGDQFRWTDQIAPTMRALCLWDDDLASISDADANAFEANARLAWQTMPEPMKMALLSDKIGFMQFVKVLALGWKEGRWVSYRLDDPVELQGEIPLARRILELAASGK